MAGDRYERLRELVANDGRTVVMQKADLRALLAERDALVDALRDARKRLRGAGMLGGVQTDPVMAVLHKCDNRSDEDFWAELAKPALSRAGRQEVGS